MPKSKIESFDTAQDKSPQKPPQEPGVETWEDEGESVEVEQETVVEVPEKTWLEIIVNAREEFSDDFKVILDKKLKKGNLSPKEQSDFDLELNKWWKENFGVNFSQRTLSAQKTEKGKQETEKKNSKLTELGIKKKEEMVRLHQALTNLDAGEPVNEFRDETRRVVYFDEENNQYFVEEGGIRKNIGIGDITSDYPWGIKYVPDGEMTEPTYRTLTKRILVNETRRELERIHNSELIRQRSYRSSTDSFNRMWPRFKEVFKGDDKETVEKKLEEIIGWIIEVIVREFLSRISLNLGLNLVVSRVTAEEDADYKYDFKIRVKHRTRGVDVQSKNINSIGFQIKSRIRRGVLALVSN